MRKLLPILCLTLAVLLWGTGEGWSADFQKATDAYNRGDYATALREIKSLAEQGNANAQYNLGMMYEQGSGILQDYKTAVKWYRLAAEQEDAGAQTGLGAMYATGRGVIQDNVYARMWGMSDQPTMRDKEGLR